MGMTKKQALEHFTKLANDHGLDESVRATFATALANDKFADEFAKGFMLESDYSASKRKVAEEAEKLRKENAEYHASLKAWAAEHKVTVEQAQTVLDKFQKYEQLYGPLDNPNPNPAATPPGLKPEEIKALLEAHGHQQSNVVGSFVRDVMKAQSDHFKRFKEPLDVDAFEPYLEQYRKDNPQASVQQAYSSWVEPKIEEQRKAEFEAAIKKAKDDAVREYASTHKIPVDSGQKEYSPAWDPQRLERLKKPAEVLEAEAEAGFFEAWAAEGARQRAAGQ